jgi:hypothetical protein
MHHHQKTAKYCIKIQGKNISMFTCKYCKKSLSTKQNLDVHISTCIKYNENMSRKKWQEEKTIIVNQYKQLLKTNTDKISFLHEELIKKDLAIRDLQKQMQEVAIQAVKRPTTSNKTQINNYIQNMKPVTEEHFLDNVQHLTIEHIKKGAEGYAEYALEYPLKDRLLCSDYSRRKVKFKDKDDNVITDPEMTTLARKFFHSIKEKNKELICKSANELKERLGDYNVMDTVVRLFDYKSDIEKGSYGEKTEFHHDFVKQVCSQTIKE